ncbi:hypothetical protein [Bacillus badius]|uniref:DNA topoisomerase III n=1 Tax=Bacillus badius TaxID=1455 RepID=A0ABR5AQT0_BACBA|nr:hypothetical protein [Bacillus badius]KIL72615.1 hypothetical protein SD78_4200 [Bacillus badius]KIL77113.1 hypothetical protein SD77_1718 [Bacillus badius]MED4716702.1 hypothetical protein [Bacillus badius]
MQVIIAEKPSVAKNIADALKVRTKKRGCHLIELQPLLIQAIA